MEINKDNIEVPDQVDATVVAKVDEANKLAMTVADITINNDSERVNSIKFLQEIKAVSKILDKERKSLTVPIDAVKNKIMDFFNKPTELLKVSEQKLKRAISSFEVAQEKLRIEEESRIRAKAYADEARKRKALMERSAKEAAKGNEEKAELLEEKAENVFVAPIVAAPKITKIAGHSSRVEWRHRVVNASKVPDNYKVIDEKMLAKFAKATKGKVTVPGVEFYPDTIITSRAASN